jgi:peptidyl-prolyl cis-trans isomerase A (cyclophilin A)
MTSIRIMMCLVFAVVVATPASIEAQDLVEIRTSEGRIVAEVYPQQAPITVTNFMDYVDDQLFDGGSFFRVVRPDNQPDDSVRIDVIQGGPDRSISRERYRPAIPLERTRDTGLLHRDGTLSMARAGPDTARAQFFICVGDQPSLDFGGARNADGQGFAAFGRVIEGMDVVRRIQDGAAEGQQLVASVAIESVRRLEAGR